jgi:hypothetical protein
MLSAADYGLDDGQILDAAVRLAPDLMFSLRVGHLAKRLKFPLTAHSDLHPLFDAKDLFVAANVSVSKKQFSSSFPDSFFPIESASELVVRAYAALAGNHAVSRDAGVKALAPKLPKDGNGAPILARVVATPNAAKTK